MTTIRERAAALNLMGKLYSPVHLPPDSTTGIVTLSWSTLISHLKEQVQGERRWHHLRAHKNCFVGSAVVNVTKSYVQNNYFGGLDFPRFKAVRICQTLMEYGVMEAVGNGVFDKGKKHNTFQDTSSSLYRFVRRPECAVLDKLESAVVSPFTQRAFVMPDKGEMDVLCHSTPVRPVTTLGCCIKKDAFMPNNPPASQNALPQSLVNEVWQEQTLLRLMQIIDLPFLESLLEARESSLQQSSSLENCDELLHNSSFLDWEILKSYRDSQTDDWLSAALHCVEFLPDQVVVEISRELPVVHDELSESVDMEQYKLLLFDVIGRHFGQPDRSPLLGDHMGDVYTIITDHLENGNLKLALEAIQLCLKLLSIDRRQQLQKLLAFMALVADPQSMKLRKELENRMIVKRTFSKAIINQKCLSKDKADLLVLFMMDNHHKAFQIPGSLHKLVSEKLAAIQHEEKDASPGPTFCSGSAERVQQSTNTDLLGLLRTIDEDPKYTHKDKKRLYAKFYQAHPEIFAQYFGPRMPSIIGAL